MDSRDKPHSDNNQEELIKCPSCKKLNLNYVQFCKYCGKKIPTTEKTIKFCPNCQKKHKSDVLYCTECGKKLVTLSNTSKTPTAPDDQKGYKIPIKHQHTNFDSENQIVSKLTKSSSLRLSESSLNGPKDVKTIKSDFFAVEIAKEYKFDYKIFSDLLSVDNLYSYFLIGVFIYIIYLFWFLLFFEQEFLTQIIDFLLSSREVFPSLQPTIVNDLIISIFPVILIEFGLFIPFLLLSVIASYYGISTRYKIELSQIIIILGINALVVFFDINIPFLILPGEIRLENLPPRKKLAKYVSIGITINVIIVSILSLPFLINIQNPTALFVSYPIFKHIFISFIILAWLNMINLLPFGNIISQLVREWKPWLFYVIFTITFGSIFVATNTVNIL